MGNLCRVFRVPCIIARVVWFLLPIALIVVGVVVLALWHTTSAYIGGGSCLAVGLLMGFLKAYLWWRRRHRVDPEEPEEPEEPEAPEEPEEEIDVPLRPRRRRQYVQPVQVPYVQYTQPVQVPVSQYAQPVQVPISQYVQPYPAAPQYVQAYPEPAPPYVQQPALQYVQ